MAQTDNVQHTHITITKIINLHQTMLSDHPKKQLNYYLHHFLVKMKRIFFLAAIMKSAKHSDFMISIPIRFYTND